MRLKKMYSNSVMTLNKEVDVENNLLVTIIITNYNYEHFLKDSIDSALNQTYKNVEVVVVDDGSKDSSRDIINSYGDQVVAIFKENGGQPSSYNAGFAASRGDIICFLDSDDMFSSEKVAEIVKMFEFSEEIGWCFHSIKLIDENSQPLNFTTTANYKSVECDFRQRIKAGRIPPCLPPSSALCFRRSLLEKILPMPTPKNIPCNDHYVKFLAVGLSKGFTLAEPLTTQRIHGSNMITLRSDRQHMQARDFLFVGLYIKQEFPQFRKFANKLFAVGMFRNKIARSNDLENMKITQSYMSYIYWHEKIQITAIVLYYYFRDMQKQLLNY